MVKQSMNDIIKYQGREAGLGVIITQLSFLLACPRPIELWVQTENNLAFEIKRIWQIPDDRLTIRVGSDPDAIPNLQSDELTAYIPYFTSDILFLMGKNVPLKNHKKKFAVLCMHHGGGLREDIATRSMPYNKYATSREYEKLFTLLDRAGYDIITMNQSTVDLEHKIYMLNEMCDLVIGYEGGLHHLAHVLKIPSIIFPWRYCDDGAPPIPPGNYYEPHRFHADRRTWFVMDEPDREILSWTPQQLQDKINELRQGRGNNILFDPMTKFDPTTLEITHPSMTLTPRLHTPEFALIRQLAPNFDVSKSI